MSDAPSTRPDGFRERGGEVTRIEAFVDAAFAFALTMLVISVGAIPDSVPKLLDALKGTPAFAACFATVAIFWYQHMSWSRRYGLDDRGSIVLSLVLVFLTMVFVYPLKYLYEGLFSWISGNWLRMDVSIRTMADLRAMFVIYGIVFCTMNLVIGLLYRQAWRRRDDLGLSPHERATTIEHIAASVMTAGIAVVSIVVACLMPDHVPPWLTGLPGMVYGLMFLGEIIPRRFVRRAQAREPAPGET